MRGTKRKISLPRRFLIDFMHASVRVPAISFSRPLDIGPLMAARAKAKPAPGWAAVFVKAFAIVAREEPVLRTLYVKLPWPHFFELPRSVAMVAVARTEDGEEFILPEKVHRRKTFHSARSMHGSAAPRMRRSRKSRPSGRS